MKIEGIVWLRGVVDKTCCETSRRGRRGRGDVGQ